MKQWLLTLIALVAVLPMVAQTEGELREYRRNSLSMVLVYHPEDEFGINIYEAFDSLPMPDKYDDHNVGYQLINNQQIVGLKRDTGFYKAKYGHVLTSQEVQKNAQYMEDMLNKAQIAKLMVAKWFGLSGDSVHTATFNTDLIQQRGQYNATDVDVELAMQTLRGVSALSDAGEELIANTFLLVNDITYVTAEEEAAAAKTSMAIIGGLMDAFLGGDTGKALAAATGAIADSFTGFNVKTHSYLFQLVWNDSVQSTFYKHQYTSRPDSNKIMAFLRDETTYRLKYVAHEYEYDKKSTLKGQYDRKELVKTICARSMDKNIVALAKQYEDFKVKTPVYSVLRDDKGRVTGYAAKIGLKEGIQENSSFQVVQRIFDPQTNKTTYRYVATLKPEKGKLWDNRYNAVLEHGAGSDLTYTTFKKASGGEILPGMLLIEGKYRKVTE